MELAPIFRYVLPVVLIFTVGLLGRTRRIGFWGAFILSILLTPIGGFLVALISGAKRIEDPPKRKKSTAKQGPKNPRQKSRSMGESERLRQP
jgi:hypothetical protein